VIQRGVSAQIISRLRENIDAHFAVSLLAVAIYCML
jgi:hypothetical protein